MPGSFSRKQTWAAEFKPPFAARLSLSQYVRLDEKDLLGTEHTQLGRLTPNEHLSRMARDGDFKDSGQALILLSVRNVMANLRCFGFVRGKTVVPVGVTNDVFASRRPFFALGGKSDGTISIELLDGRLPISPDWLWFVTGVPVLFDDPSDDALFRHIVAEAADHAHVWHLPRGNHPDATDISREHWSELHDVFATKLDADVQEASEPLLAYARKAQLVREDFGLHNVLGVDGNGRLLQLIANGRLESLGKQIKALGATRAICVDNSGSSVVRYRPADAAGSPWIQLFAAPNHRPPGTAYLLLELKGTSFGFLQENT